MAEISHSSFRNFSWPFAFECVGAFRKKKLRRFSSGESLQVMKRIAGVEEKGDIMKSLNYVLRFAALLAVLTLPVAYSQAQVRVGVGIGVGPRIRICRWAAGLHLRLLPRRSL